MKKNFNKVVVVFCSFITAVSVTACSGAKVKALYEEIGPVEISDESILTEEEKAELARMRDQKEEYLQEKDYEGMEALGEEWESFKAPVEELIAAYQSARDTFFSDSEAALLTEEERQKCAAFQSQIDDAYRNRDSNGLKAAAAEWDSYSGNIRAAIETYNEISEAAFSDTDQSLLSDDTLAEIQGFSERKEAALAARDVAALRSLKSEWQTLLDKAGNEIETAKEDMLNDWVQSANVGASFGSLFSLGTVSSSCVVDGHTIVYTFQYNIDVDKSEMQNALDASLTFTSSLFQEGVESLKTYIEDVCIRIEYKDKNGNVIVYKEFQ